MHVNHGGTKPKQSSTWKHLVELMPIASAAYMTHYAVMIPKVGPTVLTYPWPDRIKQNIPRYMMPMLREYD
jgi:hypothetical protein